MLVYRHTLRFQLTSPRLIRVCNPLWTAFEKAFLSSLVADVEGMNRVTDALFVGIGVAVAAPMVSNIGHLDQSRNGHAAWHIGQASLPVLRGQPLLALPMACKAY